MGSVGQVAPTDLGAGQGQGALHHLGHPLGPALTGVDYGQIASGEDQDITEWDAGVLTALVGADRMVNDCLLAGAVLAWSSNSFDYETNGSSDDLVEGKGDGSLQLFTISPYLGWRLDGGQSLWASVGYGWGDLTMDYDDARYDGGDGSMTGSGLDLAAALRYDTPNGLRLEGRGRTLLLHSEGLKDWGISGLVRYAPRGDDGFSISLSPKWGRTDTNNLQQLWSNHQDQFSTTGEVVSSALLLDAELRSPKLAMGSYMLTPALGFQFSPDAWTTRLGTALQLRTSLNLQLDLSRQQPEGGDTNHALGLNLEMEF